MCDCFHLAFPNWHAAPSETGAGRRLRGPEPGTEDDSTCDEPSQFTGGERPRPQGSSPVEEYPESEKYADSDKECEAEHDPHHKSASGKKTKKSGLGSMFEKRSTPKMSKLKEASSPESGVIVKTAKDGCAEGLIYGGGGKDGIFIKEVVPESPASKSLKLKEGDQILSATVYFDNVSYEDAIQILEHAQAYKVKLCLKRKPDITETEPAIESNVIPEEEPYAPEMREQGKTKRRGDARISWPKFPSFGKGRKSRFTRSHSSSEADEQRKLELSPTTSDTESPIKSQDAPKGKKRHKIKLSVLTKRGRVSSSEDQDTDTPTTGQISGKTLQTHEASDMLSPECIESPSGETLEVCVTEDLKVVEDLGLEQNEPQSVQHKVELITIDSTLKTEELTVHLTDKEIPSGIKSPDEKKKKKERSELKIKLLGKDKLHKKDAKAKSSPKRLKTLGASIETAEQPKNEKSVFSSFDPHTELQEDQLTLDAKTQITEKQTGPTFKLPKIGLSDIATEETIQKKNANVEECTTKTEQLATYGTDVKEDPYERLSKGGLSQTKLPKREDIEIPGMEDMSMRTTAKGIKEPKAVFTGHYEEIQAETVQLSIDVDSVKEAVSKLPGFKLPKVDTSGMPIPEEITVIDANAQRISVKTPTKVVDTKTKHDAQYTKFDITASPETSKTAVKLPKITAVDLTSEELLVETRVDFKKSEKKYKTKAKQSDKDIKTGVYKREDIIIPGKESAQEVTILKAKDAEDTQDTEALIPKYKTADLPSTKESEKKSKKARITTPSFGIAKPNIKIPDIGIDLAKQKIFTEGDTVRGERTIFIQEVKTSKTETSRCKEQTGGIISDVKIPDIDGIEYIDSVGGSPAKKDDVIRLTGFGVNLEGPKIDLSSSKKDADVTLPEAPEIDVNLGNIRDSIPEENIEIKKPELIVKPLQTEGELDGQGSKFKMPKVGITMPKVKGPETALSFSKRDASVTQSESKAEAELPEFPKMAADMKPPESEAEIDVKESKFKMPKLGIKTPKVKGPEIDFSLSEKDVDVTLLEAKAEVRLPDVEFKEPSMEIKAPEIKGAEKNAEGSPLKFKMPTFKLPKFGGATSNVSVEVSNKTKVIHSPETQLNPPEKVFAAEIIAPNIDIEGPSLDVKTTADEFDGKGSRFKMPKFGISMSKVKGPEIDLPKKQVDLSETNAEVKLPDVEHTEPSIDMETTGTEQDGKGSKFKMPHFGFSMPKVKGPKTDIALSKKDIDVTLPEADLGKVDVSIPEAMVDVPEAEVEVKPPEAPNISMEIKPPECKAEMDGYGGKFKIPKFGIKMPKVKGPELDLRLSKKDTDMKLPETKTEVKLPQADLGKVDISIPDCKIEDKKLELEGPDMDLNLSKKDTDTLPGTKGKINLPGAGIHASLGKAEVLMPETKVEVKKPEVEIKPLQNDFELRKTDGADIKISMPHIDIDVPTINAEVHLPEVEVKDPSGGVVIDKQPGVKVDAKLKKPRFSLPRFSFSKPSVKTPGVDVSLQNVAIPEGKVEVKGKVVDMKPLECEADVERQGSTFKMQNVGIKLPMVTGPEIDLSLSKKDVDVTLPEAKAEVKLPDVELKEHSAEVKIKAPDITFATGMPSATIEVPDTQKDIKIDEADIRIPEEVLQIDIAAPSIDTEGPSIDMKTTGVENEGKGSKFKMPKFGITMPKITGPEIDLSLSKKDVDVTLPEAKAEVKLPAIELKEPSAEVKIKTPEITVATKDTEGSSSKFKMPTFKLPKFGVGMPSATVEVPKTQKDVKIDGADIKIPEDVLQIDIAAPSIDTEGSTIDMKTTGIEHEEKGSKIKMPKFGITMPKVTGPEIDLSSSKKDVDVTLPEAKAEVKLPDIELKEPSAEVKIKAPDIKVATKDTEGSPSKFKMPTFKLPKFGVGMPSASVEVPNTQKDVKIDGADIKIPEEVLRVDITAPSIDTEGPSIDMKTTGTEHEGKGSKFKMPKFGITMPKVTGPEIDLSSSKKDVDVTLPEAKAEVKLPDIELKEPSAEVKIKAPEITVATEDTEGSPSRFKMPTFKLPKFGVGMPSATIEVPDTHKDVKIDGADIKIPEEVLRVDITAPSIDTEGPSIDMKTTGTEHEGKGSKFKMPKFGITMPKVTGPEIDLSSSKKDVDVTLPEAKAEVKLPDIELKEPSAEVKIKAPEIKVATKDKEGSPSKFKMPTFKLPKFGVGTPSATIEVPDTHKDVKIDGADINIPEEVLEVDIAAPSIDTEGSTINIKTTGTEHEVKGSKFKMPKFGITMPKVTGPEIDLSSSKKDVDVTLPEAKAEVKLPDIELKGPSAEVKIKAPEITVATEDTEGSPSRFKMPTFKLPKFGVGMPSATIEVPDTHKDVKIDGADIKIPEEVLRVDIAAPSIDTEGPSIDIKTTGSEHEGKGSKFKMPKFGITMPKVTGPEIDLSSSKKDVDVTLPEAKAEVKLPDIELKEQSAEVKIKAPEIKVATKDKEGSPSKFKMPTFKLPKFGVGIPSATIEVPDTHKDVKIDGADIKIPEEVLRVDITAPSIDTEGPSIDMKTTGTEHEGKGSKFKMPKFGITMPKVTGPEIDLSSSKKDVDVTLPEAKAEVKLPDIELKEPSAEVKIKAPEIKVATKDKEGSPSKFKMPTFKLPKFGVGMPSATIEVPDTHKDVKIDGADIKIPEEVLRVDITAPSIDTEGPSIDMKTTGTEHEGKGSKFKMPKFGITMPKVTGPEIDLSSSKKDVDVTLPEAKAEVKLPDIELKEPSAEVKIKAPEIKLATKDKEGSPSKFKMPTFKLPKFGVGMPSATIEVPDTHKDVKIDGADINIPEEVLEVDIAAPSIDTEGPSIDMKTTGTEHERKGSKFKMPKFGITMPKVTGPEIDLSSSKKDVDVTLPEAKAEVKLPDIELKEPSAEVKIKAPEITVATEDTEGSPSRFKMPTFKLPKFGVGMPSATIQVPDTQKDVKIDGADINIPEEVLQVDIAAPSIDTEGSTIDIKTRGTEHEEKGSKFKMPKFGITMPKVTGPEIYLSSSKKDVDVTLPEAKAEVKLPDVELKEPSAEVKIKAPDIKVATKDKEGSPSKFKMPTFKLPKFGVATPQVSVEVPDVDKDIKVAGDDSNLSQTKTEIKEPVGSISVSQASMTEVDAKLKKRFSLPKFSFSKQSTKEPGVDVSRPDVDVSLPEGNVEIKQFEVELKPQEGDVILDGQESKFKMPRFGISMPKVQGPELDLSSSKKDVDVTLPGAEAEVKLPDVKIKQPLANVEIKAHEIEAQTGNVEGSPLKIKMPTLTLPKFGAATPKVSVEVPDVDKTIKIDGAKLEITKEGTTVDVTAPSIDTEGLSVDVNAKGSDIEESRSKFKMPNFGISMPKVKGPETDFSLSKKDADVTLPEAKAGVTLPNVKIKEPEVGISVPDAALVEVEAKSKRPNWTFPKFSFSRTGGKTPDVNIETPKLDVTSPEAKAEVCLPDADVQGHLGAISMEESPATELDANLKKSKISLPKFSFSKSSVKEHEVIPELPHVDVSLLEREVRVKQPEMEIKAPELEAEHDGQQGSKFKLPKFGIALPKTKGPEEDLSASQKDADITLQEVKAEVKLPEIEANVTSVEIKDSDTEARSKDIGGSSFTFKMPTIKTQKLGSATSDVTVKTPDADKLEKTDGDKFKEGVVKSPSVEIKTEHVSKAAITDSETQKTNTDSGNLGSPSKFKLPSFRMPKLSFARPKPEDEYVPDETECKEDQLEMDVEMKGENKSPKMTLTSFGEILKNIDVEFDVSKTDKVEEKPETSKEVYETDEPSGKQLEAKKKETNTKQDATKSPERTGWFKFPKFGLSSPSEPAKISEKDKDEKSPVGGTVDEEISPTCSVQSSDAFADISSAMTSEHVGPSLSSPTKVTVKYSDPNIATGLGDMHSNIITSTTRTELISVEPNLPEKITILSSGVSSSSEDTLRLESGKIHVITSNIQATPEAQHSKLLTAVQVQSAGGFSLKSEANEAALWTVEDSQSDKRTVFKRHLVTETSSERSESKETIVITKQITRMFDSSEPISGDTASSIQRLRDSVHSEKMRFFDEAEK